MTTRRAGATLSNHAATPAALDWVIGNLGASVSAGDMIAGWIFTDQAATTITANAVKDDLNGVGAWQKLLSFNVTVEGFPCEASLWSVVCAAGGAPNNITATMSARPGSQGLGAAFCAYVPTATLTFASGASAIDVSHNNASTGATADSGASGSTTLANELALGFYGDDGNNSHAVTAGTNIAWSLVLANGNSDASVGIEDFLDSGSSGTAFTAQFGNPSSTGWDCLAAVYKLTSGAAPTSLVMPHNPLAAMLGR